MDDDETRFEKGKAACQLCGAELPEACRIICPNCGQKVDCSD